MSMMSSFGSIVIRFICPDLDPVVQVHISEPSSQCNSSRLGPFFCLVYILIETAQDENESVKDTFVFSVTFSTCSCLISKLSETCQ